MERVARPNDLRTFRILAALVGILILGVALRLHRLEAANLWWDEAFSVWMARKPLLEGVRLTARDVHPPLYYMVLRLQLILAGDTEFSARYLSTMAGALTVAAIYPLGRELGGVLPALLGSLLLAISRFHIWWSQEVRMYTMAALLVTLAVYVLLRQREPRQLRWGWPLYTVAVTAALYTLYLAALILPAAVMMVLILWRTKRASWPFVKSWLKATLYAVALYLPWLWFAEPSQPGQAIGENSVRFITSLYLTLLSTGNSTDIGRYTLIALAYGMVIAGVLAGLSRRREWVALAVLAPPFLLPLLLAYVLILAPDTIYAPALEARYFLLFTPVNVLLLMMATAVTGRWRKWMGVALGAGLVIVSVWSLPQHYAGRILRDQWKSAVRIIDAYAEPNDAVVILSGDRYPLFLYEFDRVSSGELSPRLLPDGVPQLAPENLDEQMEKAVADADRVWLVEIEANIQDPDQLARGWLEGQMATALASEFDHNRLTFFTPGGEIPTVRPERLAPQYRVEGDGVAGFDLPIRRFRPGDTIHLGVFARSGDQMIRLIHESGLTLAERRLPASPANSIVRHDVTFPVNRATPRGRHRLMFKDMELATISVTQSDPLWELQDVPQTVASELGGQIELLGVRLTPAEPLPGDTVEVDLYWRAGAIVEDAYTVFVQVIGPINPAAGTPVWGQHDSPPVGGTFPTHEWPVGLIVRDRHELQFAPAAPLAEYAIIVGMYDPATGERLSILGQPSGALTVGEFSTR